MILLLLGLAIVLTTSSSLFVALSSKREGKSGNFDSHFSNKAPSAGEISGSISITSCGDMWLMVLIDELSIIAKLDIVEVDHCLNGYRLSIAAIESPSGSSDGVSPNLLPLAASESRAVQFTSPDEASSKIIQLFDNLGVVISKDSLLSIPYAISCGWKTPDDCHRIVTQMLEKQSENNE